MKYNFTTIKQNYINYYDNNIMKDEGFISISEKYQYLKEKFNFDIEETDVTDYLFKDFKNNILEEIFLEIKNYSKNELECLKEKILKIQSSLNKNTLECEKNISEIYSSNEIDDQIIILCTHRNTLGTNTKTNWFGRINFTNSAKKLIEKINLLLLNNCIPKTITSTKKIKDFAFKNIKASNIEEEIRTVSHYLEEEITDKDLIEITNFVSNNLKVTSEEIQKKKLILTYKDLKIHFLN